MQDPLWWQRGIIYQIYPRSFQDNNNDGIGDLAGICRRLDYLQQLGIDAIWISPIYPSPMADFGYDVANYCDIDPTFGTLEDFDHLIERAHQHGLKVILDFVPNHTSDQHPWFVESRASRSNPKRNWYIWRDANPDGSPPNNWRSNFGGSAWEWDAHTGQYYYHAFLKEQPDLNWHNPEVRAAMYDVLRFWMNRGVDGFRVDVIWHLAKDEQFRDNPPNPGYKSGDPAIRRYLEVYSADRPEVHGIIAEMRQVIDEYKERVLIGELYLPIERLVRYYGENLQGAHLPFNFQLIDAAWHARGLRNLVAEYEAAIPEGGWPNWVLGNHDKPRIASRVGADQARIAAMLLLTLRGTPTLYYGDELGIENVHIPQDRIRDPWERNEPGLGVNRDPARTPMQWDGTKNAGFSLEDPWLPLTADWPVRNIQRASLEPSSLLTLYRRLIELRRQRPCLSRGDYHMLGGDDHVLLYDRKCGDDHLLIALNLSRERRLAKLPIAPQQWRPVLNSSLTSHDRPFSDTVVLGPNEGLILEPAA